MTRRFALLFVLLVLCGSALGQATPKLTNSKYGFSMEPPVGSTSSVHPIGSVLEFTGDERRYGSGARSILSSVKRISMAADDVEEHMKRPATVRMFHNTLVSSMLENFPDLVSVDRAFIEFNERPAISGTFTFAAKGKSMRGRYMILLVREQKSLYTFTWSCADENFKGWDAATKASIRTLTFTPTLELTRDET